jgi:hypothetical protein
MSRESFRRDINREFDAISGSPSPSLSARVRGALAETRPSRPAPYWMAGLAAALIALIVIGVLVVANLNKHPVGEVPGGGPNAQSPSPYTTLSPTSPASPGQTPPDTSLPPFTCSSTSTLTGTSSPTTAFVDLVRTGTHPGYDRVTIEFNNGEPTSVDLRPQAGTTFTQSPSGQSVTLKGSSGLLVVIHGADQHTAFNGSIDFTLAYLVLVELRQLEDFEGTVQWGLGLSKSACYRAFFLTNPARLVIDIQNT